MLQSHAMLVCQRLLITPQNLRLMVSTWISQDFRCGLGAPVPQRALYLSHAMSPMKANIQGALYFKYGQVDLRFAPRSTAMNISDRGIIYM